MRIRNGLLLSSGAAVAGATALLNSTAAFAAAQEPSISGDRWVAFAIIGALVLAILLFVFASVGVARRDAAAQRGSKSDDEGLPIFGGDDD